MNRNQVENLYLVNGLNDFQVKSIEDILKTHGIDVRTVDGYSRLDDVNRLLYEKFIINFFNAQGLETRATLVPTGIYYVEEIEYLVKEKPEDDCYTVSGFIVNVIDRNGIKSVLHHLKYDRYEGLKIEEGDPKYYLRIEYNHDDSKGWLHVIDDKTWY